MGASELVSRFGEVEGVYRPSPGQTIAGTLVSVGGAAVCFAAAAFGCGLDATIRVCGALLGLGCLGLAYWLFRQRRWRLVMFSGGLVQVRPDGVDELPWSEARELVQTRLKGAGERTVRVTVVGAGRRLVVNPVNFRSQAKLFEALVAAAERRGVPVRVEWEDAD